MPSTNPSQPDLLAQSRDRAATLLKQLRQESDDLNMSSIAPMLPAESIEAGRIAMERAVASAQCLLAAIDNTLNTQPDTE
ncbi:MAG TPA: hypothetical protein VFE58_12575 [Tepidisphaeraceae bacterium]|nr:hypothetical protein [Tepidisphaeraceae bacterium]